MCGGTLDETINEWTTKGLSPRVRGNRGQPPRCRWLSGTIPACAGEPGPFCVQTCCLRDYPRVCGGTIPAISTKKREWGLSPRVRGNRLANRLKAFALGTIPACAGEPRRPRRLEGRQWDYPRVCGGTRICRSSAESLTGLSPRVRGNQHQHWNDSKIPGTIPACAGEPLPVGSACQPRGDYPRVCGGTSIPLALMVRDVGLSPRVRGNPIIRRSMARCCGTIPACAGEPNPNQSPGRSIRDYPCVCGGTSGRPGAAPTITGLSPRVRGNRRTKTINSRRCGTIPACAGEPALPCRCWTWPWDYPRVCGGTCVGCRRLLRQQGLSPRVRGNRSSCLLSRCVMGTIPACAGEPLEALTL